MLAHALTAVRLALVPVLCWSMLRSDPGPAGFSAAGLSAACLAVAIASDLLDGRIARRVGSASPFGRLFDHLTDGTFVSAGLFAAAYRGAVPWVLPVLVVLAFTQYVLDSLWLRGSRELLMNGLGRWNGILYFAPLVGDTLVRLGLAWLRPGVTALAWGLVASTLLSMADRAHAVLAAPGPISRPSPPG